MKIRLMSASGPRFLHEGLNITESWSEVDTDAIEPNTLDAIEEYTGSHIRIHPDDVEEFASRMDLEFKDGRLYLPDGDDGERAKWGELGRRHQTAARRQSRRTPASEPTEGDGLRADGPTFEEFVKSGYQPEMYPPVGYAEKPSKGLTKYRKDHPAPARESTPASEPTEGDSKR
ncbi:MAG: hypothetical protein H0U52_06765 [Chloroflexi bacterium]|nr:hypothetical protein [Chloroflexota bacterium]